jgi:hypothetical protein
VARVVTGPLESALVSQPAPLSGPRYAPPITPTGATRITPAKGTT